MNSRQLKIKLLSMGEEEATIWALGEVRGGISSEGLREIRNAAGNVKMTALLGEVGFALLDDGRAEEGRDFIIDSACI